VHREFKPTTQDKPVDYSLAVLRKPRLLVEAKPLGESLSDRKWIGQILGYASVAGVEWCVLTDGNEYRFYNATVPLDAAGCPTEIVKQIRTQGGDYLVAVKGNQPALQRAARAAFARAAEPDFAGCPTAAWRRRNGFRLDLPRFCNLSASLRLNKQTALGRGPSFEELICFSPQPNYNCGTRPKLDCRRIALTAFGG